MKNPKQSIHHRNNGNHIPISKSEISYYPQHPCSGATIAANYWVLITTNATNCTGFF